MLGLGRGRWGGGGVPEVWNGPKDLIESIQAESELVLAVILSYKLKGGAYKPEVSWDD